MVRDPPTSAAKPESQHGTLEGRPCGFRRASNGTAPAEVLSREKREGVSPAEAPTESVSDNDANRVRTDPSRYVRYRYGVSPKYFAGGGVHPTTATTSSSRRLHSHEREGPSGRIARARPPETRARPSAGASSVDDASRYSDAPATRRAKGGERRGRCRGGRAGDLVAEPTFDARSSPRRAEEGAGSRSRSESREATREERTGRRAAATFASGSGDDAEAREVDALARRSHLGSSVTGCRRGSETVGEGGSDRARVFILLARPFVASRRTSMGHPYVDVGLA